MKLCLDLREVLQLYNVCLGELLRHEVMSGSKRGVTAV